METAFNDVGLALLLSIVLPFVVVPVILVLDGLRPAPKKRRRSARRV